MRFVHTDTDPARQWGHLGLLVAFTAGFWCMAVGFEAPEDPERCAWERDVAQVKCGTSCVQPLAIITSSIAGPTEYSSPSWITAPAAASHAPSDTPVLAAGLPVLTAPSGPQFTSAGPLYHVAPKQSPPAAGLG